MDAFGGKWQKDPAKFRGILKVKENQMQKKIYAPWSLFGIGPLVENFPFQIVPCPTGSSLAFVFNVIFCPCRLWDSSPLKIRKSPFSISWNRQGESQAGVSHPAALRKVTMQQPVVLSLQWLYFLGTSKTWGRFKSILNISLIVQMCGSTITWYCFRFSWKGWGLTGWVGLGFPKKKLADCDSWILGLCIKPQHLNHVNDANMGPTLFLQKAPWFLKNRNRRFRITKPAPLPNDRSGSNVSVPAFRRDLFNYCDPDESGNISMEEFQAVFFGEVSAIFGGVVCVCVFFSCQILVKCLFPIFCTTSEGKINIPTLDFKHVSSRWCFSTKTNRRV